MDGVDLGRYFRALEVEEVLKAERLHDGFLAGEIEAADIPRSVWERIQRHNRLVKP